MKIRGNKLKQQAEKSGVTPAQLADALASPGFGPEAALAAINNWMVDRDHPRCTAKHIRSLAGAMGCEVKDIASFQSRVNHHRGSGRKARLLADLIRGKSVDQAINLLTFTTKRAAVNIKKCLMAAVADAEQFDADASRLVVTESRVDDGPRIKRFQPKDRGRAHPIIKPLSHITISVEERASAR